MADHRGETKDLNKNVKFDSSANKPEGGSPLRANRAGGNSASYSEFCPRSGCKGYLLGSNIGAGRYYDLPPRSRYDYRVDAATAASTDYSRGIHCSVYDKYTGSAAHLPGTFLQ